MISHTWLTFVEVARAEASAVGGHCWYQMAALLDSHGGNPHTVRLHGSHCSAIRSFFRIARHYDGLCTLDYTQFVEPVQFPDRPMRLDRILGLIPPEQPSHLGRVWGALLDVALTVPVELGPLVGARDFLYAIQVSASPHHTTIAVPPSRSTIIRLESVDLQFTIEAFDEAVSVHWSPSVLARRTPWRPPTLSFWECDAVHDNGIQCVICMDRPAGVRLRPCGHKVVCIDCFARLCGGRDEPRLLAQCVVCKATVTDVRRDNDPVDFIRMIEEDT